MANISGSLSSGLKGVSEWDGFSKAPAAARESLSKTKDLISKGWLVPILLSVVALLFVFAGVSAAIQGLRTTEASVAFDAWAGNEGPSLPLLAMATNAALHNPVDIRFDLENFVWVSGSRDLSGRASVELPMTLIGGLSILLLAIGASGIVRRRSGATVTFAASVALKISIVFAGLVAGVTWFGESSGRNGFGGDSAQSFKNVFVVVLVVSGVAALASVRNPNATMSAAALERGVRAARRMAFLSFVFLALALAAGSLFVAERYDRPSFEGPAFVAVALPASVDAVAAISIGSEYDFVLDADAEDGSAFEPFRTRSTVSLKEFPVVGRPGRYDRAPIALWALVLVPLGAALLGSVQIGKAKNFWVAAQSASFMSLAVGLLWMTLSRVSSLDYSFDARAVFDIEHRVTAGADSGAVFLQAAAIAFLGGLLGQVMLRSRGKAIPVSLGFLMLLGGVAGAAFTSADLSPSLGISRLFDELESVTSPGGASADQPVEDAGLTSESTVSGREREDAARIVQSNLRNSLTAFKVFYTDDETYLANPSELRGIEPSLDFKPIGSLLPSDAGTSTIGYHAVDQVVLVAGVSTAGDWFCITDVATGSDAGTYYGIGTDLSEIDVFEECRQASDGFP